LKVASGAAEIDQPAFGQHDQPLAIGKEDLASLRLDLLPRIVAQRLDLDLAVEMADVADEARSFMCRIWSIVITSMLPVAVTRCRLARRPRPSS
jgi:hypothetical protein